MVPVVGFGTSYLRRSDQSGILNGQKHRAHPSKSQLRIPISIQVNCLNASLLGSSPGHLCKLVPPAMTVRSEMTCEVSDGLKPMKTDVRAVNAVATRVALINILEACGDANPEEERYLGHSIRRYGEEG